MSRLERVVETACTVGEGPLWHPDHELLYWVDIPAGYLFRFDPTTGDDEHVVSIDRALGGFTIQATGSLLLFEGGGRIQQWRARSEDGTMDHEKSPAETGRTLETIHPGLPEASDTRFNDVIADPAGRVFAGTMPTEDRLGRLYRIDRDGQATVVERDLDIPNGMGVSGDRSTFYLAVSDDEIVYAYDYDEESGELSNRRRFLETGDERGVPDGLTVDADDHVWLARWDGSAVDRYAPDGSHDRRIDVPPPKASSLTFGGPDCGDLYVTTAVGEGDAADDHSEAGSLYRTRPGVTGVPEFRSRIGPTE